MEHLKESCESLANALFDALQKFDEENIPLGLYTMNSSFKTRNAPYRKEMENRVIWGTLLRNYCFPYPHGNFIGFEVSPDQKGIVSTERISLLKVSQYGNSYHVDKNVNTIRQWDEIDLKTQIKQLASSDSVTSGIQMQMVLLVGFDKGPYPLGVEIRRLQEELGPLNEQLSFFDRSWPDASGRGFYIRATIWAKLEADTDHDTRS